VINLSVILCLIAALFGMYALIRWFCILRKDVYTNTLNVLPIMIMTISWLSAAVTFYQTETFNSPINGQRIAMIVGWVWLIYLIKIYRDNNIKKEKVIKSQQDLINKLTAK